MEVPCGCFVKKELGDIDASLKRLLQQQKAMRVQLSRPRTVVTKNIPSATTASDGRND
jgi:hypothetical protein